MAIVEKINADSRASLADPAIASRIAEMGGIAGGNPQPEFAAYVASEAARWRQIVRDADIRVN
jgi:tripartite-type tricarboxylate transporter receptor subunit TctC